MASDCGFEIIHAYGEAIGDIQRMSLKETLGMPMRRHAEAYWQVLCYRNDHTGIFCTNRDEAITELCAIHQRCLESDAS